MHADCFRRIEFEAVSIGLDREFVETALNVSLNDVDIFRPIADQEISSRGETSSYGKPMASHATVRLSVFHACQERCTKTPMSASGTSATLQMASGI